MSLRDALITVPSFMNLLRIFMLVGSDMIIS